MNSKRRASTVKRPEASDQVRFSNCPVTFDSAGGFVELAFVVFEAGAEPLGDGGGDGGAGGVGCEGIERYVTGNGGGASTCATELASALRTT